MNCWPDGTELTTEDMLDIGVEAGVWTREQIPDLWGIHEKMLPSFAIQKTAQTRLDMMWDGKLVLRSRLRVVPEAKKPELDQEIVAFLTRGSDK